MESTEHNQVEMDRASRLMKIQSDLLETMKEFPSIQTGTRTIAMRTGVSERTLRRIIRGTHSPTFQTMLKIYRYLKGTYSDRETIMAMPEILSSYTNKEQDNFSLSNPETNFSYDIDIFLQSDSVFRSIYVESATGEVFLDSVAFNHGNHGVNVLKKMNDLGIIKGIRPNTYTSSKKRASLDEKSAHEIAKYLLEYKFSPEKGCLSGENMYHLFFEGVNKETYNELLKIDWSAYEKKKNLLKNASSKGEIKYWSIGYTDTLSNELIYNDCDNKEEIQ